MARISPKFENENPHAPLSLPRDWVSVKFRTLVIGAEVPLVSSYWLRGKVCDSLVLYLCDRL